jgi:general secretion pathway protein J
MRGRAAGFTLIELLAAMAILAVVSLMAVQALNGALFQRDILVRVDDEAAELARALALLRHDLEAVAPVPRTGDDGGVLPAVGTGPQGFSLMRAGIASLPGRESGGFGRVDWVLDGRGVLARRMVPNPAQVAEPGPLVAVLTEVSAITLAPLGGTLPDDERPAVLPDGFEVIVTHARHGVIRLVMAR